MSLAFAVVVCGVLTVCMCTDQGAGEREGALKVLVMYTVPSPSHGVLGGGVVKALLDDGHQVTYITPFPMKTAHKNLRKIEVVGAMDSLDPDLLKKNERVVDLELYLNGEAAKLDEDFMMELMVTLTQTTLQEPRLQAIMNDPAETFDLVIAEWMFTEVAAGLSAVFGCPYIWTVSTEPHFLTTALVDEYLHPAYSVKLFSEHVAPLTFTQRVFELYMQLITYFKKEFVVFSHEKKVYEEIFGPIVAKRGGTLPPLREIKYNASLVLGNSHVSLGDAVRLPVNYKSIGGYFIPSSPPPLPQNLQNIMDKAEHGVIYFSMGTNLQSKDLPDSMKRGLVKMFGGLKQTVVWKFEEALPGLPSNVHVVQFAPQHSILAHPNCVLFITHGGQLSTVETIHFGKPIIGVPVFFDQHANVKRAASSGFAVHVTLSYSLAEDLAVAINKVLNDPKYGEKARELSTVYHDRPMTAAQELAFWARHAVRTRGAPRLRSPALAVPLYQKLYLDLAALLLAAITLIVFIVQRTLAALLPKTNVSKEKKIN